MWLEGKRTLASYFLRSKELLEIQLRKPEGKSIQVVRKMEKVAAVNSVVDLMCLPGDDL